MEEKKLDAEVLAAQPEIHEKIISLISRVKLRDLSPKELKSTPELTWLRKYLGATCRKYGFIGFVVLDTTGYQVGALLEEPIGKRQLIERSDFFYRSLQGDTAISHPFPGEVTLPDTAGTWRENWPTMFASTPIRGKGGHIVGVLAFRIRPESGFTQMLEVSQFGKTGETFAFDDQGLLLSNSRFTDRLKTLGLIPNLPGITAILKVHMRVPQMQTPPSPAVAVPASDSRPLTRMAASAVKGKSGVDVDGYIDYRGTQVVGAWIWLPGYHFGMATEIDVREAFRPLYTLTRGFMLMFGLLVLASFIAVLLRRRQVLSEQQRNQAWEQVKESEAWRRAIMENAMHGIITTDPFGIVQFINPATEQLFGYQAQEILGGNVNRLMPEPYRSQHDGYLERYRTTGVAQILGQVIEIKGERKDGSVFELEISVNQISIGSGYFFSGILRDITARKQADKQIKTRAEQQAGVAQLGKCALAGTGLQELMDLAVGMLQRTLKVEYTKILEYLPDENCFLLKAGLGWENDLVGKAIIPAGRESHAGFTFQSREPVMVEDFHRDARFSVPALLADHKVVSGMSTIIPTGKASYGVLGVHSTKPRQFTSEEIYFLQAVANVLATAIERLQSDDQVRHYAKELERSNAELEDFASIASHDLQEPLRKAMLFGDRIKMKYPVEETGQGIQYIDRLQNSMGQMQEFINDLLRFSRVTRTQEPMKMVSLDDILNEVLSNLAEQIRSSQGTVRVDHPLPTIAGRRVQLVQLFQNLISNSLKYCRNNIPPQVAVRYRPQGTDTIAIVVEDNGIGIEPKYRERVFRPFERLHTQTEFSGSGIGLAICAKVIGQHAGKLHIEDSSLGGTAFVLTFPPKKASEVPALSPHTDEKNESGARAGKAKSGS